MKKIILIPTILLAFHCFAQKFPTNADKLCNAAIELTKQKVTYDATYTTIPYPNGDVSNNKGVCTDVVIRA